MIKFENLAPLKGLRLFAKISDELGVEISLHCLSPDGNICCEELHPRKKDCYGKEFLFKTYDELKSHCDRHYGESNLDEFRNLIEERISEMLRDPRVRRWKGLIGKKGVAAKIEVVPQFLINGDIHGWKVYVIFSMDVEGLFLYYGDRYKQKAFVFVDDGVFEKKFPPYPMRDDSSPTGWIGASVENDTIIEVK
ncbi:MAG: hypothetical protein QW228_01040 [Candidatus Aenigmatarchaeota archaeon]